MGTVKGQFIYACVIIVPLDHGSNKVFIDCKPELDEPLGHVKESCVLFLAEIQCYCQLRIHCLQQEPKIVSDRNLAVVVRQLALHCNLAAQIQKSLGSGREPYSSNWLERLRQIKRIRFVFARTLLGRAVTWVRGFVLGSREAAKQLWNSQKTFTKALTEVTARPSINLHT